MFCMTFEEAKQITIMDETCFCCGRHFTDKQPVVVYDGQRSIGMHPSCANAMAQRLITDTWVNRSKWQNELIDLK